jgi:hypothetical protein
VSDVNLENLHCPDAQTIKQEAKEWARFLYKLYREHPEIVALVLEDGG